MTRVRRGKHVKLLCKAMHNPELVTLQQGARDQDSSLGPAESEAK